MEKKNILYNGVVEDKFYFNGVKFIEKDNYFIRNNYKNLMEWSKKEK